jgi:hypothetical protein
MIGPQFPEEPPGRVPERTLRTFAGLCLLIVVGLFILNGWRHDGGSTQRRWVAGFLAALIGVSGLFRPNSIRWVYLGAMALTRPIGHLVGGALLAVVYYGVMTPIALAFRLAGRDGLARFRSGAESYWVDRLPTTDVRLYLRQYQRQVTGDQASSVTVLAAAPAPAVVAEVSSNRSPAFPGATHGST